MKVAAVLTSLLVGASSFGNLPQTSPRRHGALRALLSEEEMTSDQKEIKRMVEKWREVKLMDRVDAEANLDSEWLEAYNRFHEKYAQDMELMMEIKEKVAKMVEPARVEKKGTKQRKRDASQSVVARAAALQAMKKKQ